MKCRAGVLKFVSRWKLHGETITFLAPQSESGALGEPVKPPWLISRHSLAMSIKRVYDGMPMRRSRSANRESERRGSQSASTLRYARRLNRSS
jgi:hypothetical protein